MNDITNVLSAMRKSFSFLWDEYGFRLVGLMPKSGYRDSGYYAQLENDWCVVAFQSESGFLEDIGVALKNDPSNAEFVNRWAFLTAGEKKHPQLPYTVENVFDSFAEFSRPYLIEMVMLIKSPALFEQTLKDIKQTAKINKITVEMIRAERTRLHSLGIDSSLGAAMENLRKRGKDE